MKLVITCSDLANIMVKKPRGKVIPLTGFVCDGPIRRQVSGGLFRVGQREELLRSVFSR